MYLIHKRKIYLLIVLIIVSSIIPGCNKYVSDNKTNVQSDEEVIRAKGTIKFINLEGGFFGIIADDGSKYNPLNLPNKYQRDGLGVSFEGKLRTDMMSINMWGKLIEIINIKELL